MLQVIGVVTVENGAVRHRARQVGAEAAVGIHLQLQCPHRRPVSSKPCAVFVLRTDGAFR